MSCDACKVVRQLDPGLVPGSCEQCGKTDLLESNDETWELFNQFPGLVRSGMFGTEVDYAAAFQIMDRLYITEDEQCLMLRKLEAVRTGLAGKKKGR